MNRFAAHHRNHPGHWPLPARLLLLVLTIAGSAGAGLMLYTEPRSSARAAQEIQLQALQTEFRNAARRSVVLPALQARSEQLDGRLNSANGTTDDDHLQSRIGERAEQLALVLDSFRPLTPGSAELGVSGDYAALLRFVAELSQPPQALLFDPLEISIHQQTLSMKTSVSSQPPSANQEPSPP